jgi:GNAT superfamily N-acetyltransferase
MSMVPVTIREPATDLEMRQYYDLRWRVLREPWAQPRGLERDEYESEGIHRAAFLESRVVGVGRIHLLGSRMAQVRYMAVETGMRKLGVGSALLIELEKLARFARIPTVTLNARDTAIPFYLKHGYRLMRPSELLFNSIAQWEMKKWL